MIEQLESRKMFNVTSVTEGYPGFWTITCDNGNDNIAITATGPESAQYQIIGNNSISTPTSIGGEEGVVKYLFVNTGNGLNTVTVTGTSWDSENQTEWGCTLSGGSTKDVVFFDGISGRVDGWGGEDEIHMKDGYRDEVHAGNDNDKIYLTGKCVDPDIHGDDNDDLIDASGNSYGVILQGDYGADTILGSNYGDQLYLDEGGGLVEGNGGDDYIAGGTQPCTLRGGDGDDFLDASENGAPDVLDGGAGNDYATVDSYDTSVNVERFN